MHDPWLAVFRYERWLHEPRRSAWVRGTVPHPALAEVQTWLVRRYRTQFDSLALAWYHDGRDSVAWHRDRELRWLDDTLIGVRRRRSRRGRPDTRGSHSALRHVGDDARRSSAQRPAGGGW